MSARANYFKVEPKAKLCAEGGQEIEVPMNVYRAFFLFMTGIERPAGSVEIDFNNGGVAGVRIHQNL
jgi:hypothetical protein